MTSVARSKESARSSYNRMSGWYDLIAEGSERKFREKGLELLNASGGETVLEVGCGTGHSLLTLGQRVGSAGRVYGFDLSDGMLGQARSRLNRSEAGQRIPLQRGDAAHLPFPAESFDALFMSFTLELFDTPDIPLVLEECQRVLKQGGRLSIVALAKKKKFAVSLYEWFHLRLPSYVDCRPIYVRDVMTEAEFHLVTTIEYVMWGLPVDVILACKR
jgi:demethylmenaquinone methyltransferase/2-methoxy-6-polyprenyl-1,4-benzoquinol methylase